MFFAASLLNMFRSLTKTVSVFLLILCTASGIAAENLRLPLELPPEIYLVPGVECNIYFENLVLTLAPKNYAYKVNCTKGRNDAGRWRFTPTVKDVGTYDWKLTVYDSANRVAAEGSTRLVVVPPDAGKNKNISLLVIGDSLTDVSVYPLELKNLLGKPGNPQVTFIGSHGGSGKAPDKIAHEGYGGWRWKTFCTQWSEDKAKKYRAKSKFLTLKNGRPVLDFQQYLDRYNQGKKPDFITVMLGTNDIFDATDKNINEAVDSALNHARLLLKEFQKVAPDALIGVALTVPPAASQDAFGANYRCRQTRWQFRRNQFHLVERMIAEFSKPQWKNVSLIPAFTALDCQNNYPVRSEVINSRNGKKVLRQCNGVHPAKEGYYQIADVFYCWLKYQLSKQK